MTAIGPGHAIDFGTSHSAIAVCLADGTTVTGPASAGAAGGWSIPTALCVRDGAVLVGPAAEDARVERPAAYRREFKRDLGRPDATLAGGIAMTAVDMTAHVLRCLRERAQARVPEDPGTVVITVPAAWEARRRSLMREAAVQAGYGGAEVSFVAEPAAALADAFGIPERGTEDLTSLVYDLGGGTFDCAVVRRHRAHFEVLGLSGLPELGGADFDRLILDLVSRQADPAAGLRLDGPAPDAGALRTRLALRAECEAIKWTLSREDRCEKTLTMLRPPALVSVERSAFEEEIRPLLEETIAVTERMLRDLGLTWRGVDRVIPAGGSSAIPLVREMLARASGRTLLYPPDPARSVVNGAAELCHAALRGVRLDAQAQREDTVPIAAPGELGDPVDAAGAAGVISLLDRHRDRLPSRRAPNVIVCGGTGAGKTTTVNTLFGEEVGEVSSFARGTVADELYEWEAGGRRLDIVDLPGLGDAEELDRQYHGMYLRRAAEADGFIVVVAPPRPANAATLKTVDLLLEYGVEPERIVFAYNQLTRIDDVTGGQRRHLTLDGLAGPASAEDARLVDKARTAFHGSLDEEVRGGRFAGRFPPEKVVPYDALSGWNLHVLLDAVLQTLPGDTPVPWREAAAQAADDLRRRTAERIARKQADAVRLARAAAYRAVQETWRTAGTDWRPP